MIAIGKRAIRIASVCLVKGQMPSLAGWALVGQSFVAMRRTDFRLAHQLLDDASRRGDSADTSLRATIAHLRGSVLYHEGKAEEARPLTSAPAWRASPSRACLVSVGRPTSWCGTGSSTKMTRHPLSTSKASVTNRCGTSSAGPSADSATAVREFRNRCERDEACRDVSPRGGEAPWESPSPCDKTLSRREREGKAWVAHHISFSRRWLDRP
jgi:hypothetical protein